MKTECNNIRWVDEFSIKINLTKQDVAELISTGKLRDSIGYKENKEIKIEIEFHPEL